MWDDRWFQPVFITSESALNLAHAHDLKAASARLGMLPPGQFAPGYYDTGSDQTALVHALAAMEHGDWNAAIDVLSRYQTLAHTVSVKTHGVLSDRGTHDSVTAPLLAILYAKTGNWAKADALLKSLPDDCDVCVRARGQVEAIRGNRAAAEHWFALVSARAPLIPFADTDWGRMLMAKGDLDGAMAKFESANNKGPHFADPLEMWGEALIAQNRSGLALAKFEEANKYAPNWGRLHLKWGEASLWSGDKAGAQKQFAVASALALTQAERGELGRMKGMHV
jgi:tetratricopeptide (TPR) repeat protein